MSTAKLTNWMVAQEVLGFVIDTQPMRISVPVQKIDEIRAMSKEWPLNSTYARIKEVASLIGKLRTLHNGYPAWEVHGLEAPIRGWFGWGLRLE